MNKRRFIIILSLTAAVILSAVAVIVSVSVLGARNSSGNGDPNAFDFSDYERVELDDGTIRIVGYNGEHSNKNFTVPGSMDGRRVTEIGRYAFSGKLTGVEKLVLPSCIVTLDDGAFANNKDIKEVDLAMNGVLETINGAFANCVSLTSVTLPASVTQLMPNAFSGCVALTEIVVDSDNAALCSQDGILYSKREKQMGNSLLYCPEGKDIRSFTVPAVVTEIASRAFYNNKFLTEIDLNNVSVVRESAFDGCSTLGEIASPCVDLVAQNAVRGTVWLSNAAETVVLGRALYAYDGTQAELDLSEYASVSDFAFEGNVHIRKVTVNGNFRTIGSGAFLGCRNLAEVYLHTNNMVYVGENAFENNAATRKIYVPSALYDDYAANELWKPFLGGVTVHGTQVEYVLYGGTVNDSSTLTGNIDYGALLTLPKPVREHYRFAGWYEDSNLSGDPLPDFILWESYSDSITYYAKWTPVSYRILLFVDGGTLETSSTIDYTVENSVTLPAPTRTGYTFAGWYDGRELGSNRVNTPLPSGTGVSMNLYARWAANNYIVSLDYRMDEPVGAMPTSVTVTYDESYDLPYPVRTNYKFMGWRTESGTYYSNESGKEVFAAWTLSENITLYAEWVAV